MGKLLLWGLGALFLFFGITIGAALLLPDKPETDWHLSPQCIGELKTIGITTGRIRVVEVTDTQYRVSVSSVLTPDTELVPTTEDVYRVAAAFANAVAQESVKVLERHGVTKDVSAWMRLPWGDGTFAILGNVRYNSDTGTYSPFVRYK